MLQRTLVLMKPDAVSRGICGEVLSRFEKVGLKIVGSKMCRPNADFFYKHYEEIGQVVSRHGQGVYDMLLEMMMSGPVMALVLEGCDAPELVRKLVGPTEPKSAAPGTIRGDYASISYKYSDALGQAIRNVVHASGNLEEAEKEIALWFSSEELVSY